MKDAMQDFSKIKSDLVLIFSYQASCGFLVGVSSGLNGTLFHALIAIGGALFASAGGLDNLWSAIGAVLSSGLCWSLGVPGLLTYGFYYYYVPESLKDCQAKAFV